MAGDRRACLLEAAPQSGFGGGAFAGMHERTPKPQTYLRFFDENKGTQLCFPQLYLRFSGWAPDGFAGGANRIARCILPVTR
jgi:hypothetical protein